MKPARIFPGEDPFETFWTETTELPLWSFCSEDEYLAAADRPDQQKAYEAIQLLESLVLKLKNETTLREFWQCGGFGAIGLIQSLTTGQSHAVTEMSQAAACKYLIAMRTFAPRVNSTSWDDAKPKPNLRVVK